MKAQCFVHDPKTDEELGWMHIVLYPETNEIEMKISFSKGD